VVYYSQIQVTDATIPYYSCIDALGSFMTPILRGVQEYTGLHSVVLFGGPIPRYGGELRTVQYVHAPAMFIKLQPLRIFRM
jgi:hypothetical protein